MESIDNVKNGLKAEAKAEIESVRVTVDKLQSDISEIKALILSQIMQTESNQDKDKTLPDLQK